MATVSIRRRLSALRPPIHSLSQTRVAHKRIVRTICASTPTATYPPASLTYTYDGENRLTNYLGSSATYSFDGNGMRVKKVASGTTTVYIFSGSKVIAEYDNGAAPASPSREYIYSGGALLAKIE